MFQRVTATLNECRMLLLVTFERNQWFNVCLDKFIQSYRIWIQIHLAVAVVVLADFHEICLRRALVREVYLCFGTVYERL